MENLESHEIFKGRQKVMQIMAFYSQKKFKFMILRVKEPNRQILCPAKSQNFGHYVVKCAGYYFTVIAVKFYSFVLEKPWKSYKMFALKMRWNHAVLRRYCNELNWNIAAFCCVLSWILNIHLNHPSCMKFWLGHLKPEFLIGWN